MDNNQINNNKVKENNEKQGRGLFYGVIAVATFIIMAVGATYAYFTATTNSTPESVRTGSATLQLEYISYQDAWINRDLIPADTNVVEYSFENQNDKTLKDADKKSNILCKDDYGNSICSVYVFQVRNTSPGTQTVALEIISTGNSFSSLNAMAYELTLPADTTDYDSTESNNGSNDPVFKENAEDTTEGAITVVDGNGNELNNTQYSPVYVNRNDVQKTLLKYIESDDGNGTVVMQPSIDRLLVRTDNLVDTTDPNLRKVKLADSIEISGRNIKTFAVVLYIKNEDRDQTESDALKSFTGQIIVNSSGDGTSGRGVIGISQTADLQSGQTLEGTDEPQDPGQGSSDPNPDQP